MNNHYISDTKVWIPLPEPKPPEGHFGICVGEPQWEWIDLTNCVISTSLAPATFSVSWEEK